MLLTLLLLQTACATKAAVNNDSQLTLIAANGGAWYRQVNLQLHEVLGAATSSELQIINATPLGFHMALRGLKDQAGAVVFQSPANSVKLASEGKLTITKLGGDDNMTVEKEPVARIDGITALFPIPALITYVVVSDLSGLTRLDDLPELDVAWLVFENKAELITYTHFLRSAKLKSHALLLSESSLPETVADLRDERIDGFIFKRLGQAEDLSNALQSLEDIGIRILSLSDEHIKALHLTPIEIPADTFAGQSEQVVTGSLRMFAYANAHVSDDMAYQLVKAFWENQNALVGKSTTWSGITPALLDEVSTPFHPGALRYYQEIGVELPDNLH
ncbi:TAXI family TRAP transporter solute-binding subunit [Granulosicoccus antarcticus]|uniref:TAXI family TRAP transporter solute-binding subunit n=1 Tax=Granulosicoccus antarcticus TaxID=437505 RepID=UPI0012FDD5D8|nr:TAXI family TRAP transporter solute-binding subunit [Granulosicoccus antarcticus]